ncbi:hypothetical protein niasHT_002495 [Heterodera trifolii]|uniref:CYRIA/CYRIB Rac1 binding domain-containing protein n=1 Tax=Heterodera trifolii TaxID=157864 RepID=A0ABD2M806_9BILA
MFFCAPFVRFSITNRPSVEADPFILRLALSTHHKHGSIVRFPFIPHKGLDDSDAEEYFQIEQLLSKNFAKVLALVVRYDMLKASTPSLQNAFSLFRQILWGLIRLGGC